ncbi:MAG: EAL domain-containing protein [Nitrospirota bacterium]
MPDVAGKTGPLALVADDDPVNRLLAREAIELAGAAVVEAESGAQTLEAFARLRPDIVLLDVVMPDMDGFATCAELRRLPYGERVPVLIMTGLDDLESITRAYDVGATDFTVKPFIPLILSHRIRYMLRASRAMEALRESEANLAHAQRLARLGNWQLEIPTSALTVSEEGRRILGLPQTAPVTIETLAHAVHVEDQEFVTQSLQATLTDKAPLAINLRVPTPDGTERIVHMQAEVVCGAAGTPERMFGTVQDVTDRKRAEEQIHRLAYYDGLTNLPNRRLFRDRLLQALASAQRRQSTLAILLLNLDRLKRINDTLGHSVGDQVLRGVAERLMVYVRRSDSVARHAPDGAAAVSRLGGDEFTVLLTDLESVQDAAKVARRLLKSLAKPFKVEGHEVFVTASIGLSLFPADGTDAESLLKNADAAMNHAKEQGRNVYRFYSQEMNADAAQRLTLESKLRRALDRGEFELHYQPQVDLRRWNIVGVEALIRWRHPELGTIPPAKFIPLAEETGLIHAIGEWAIRTACAQHRAWLAAGFPPIRMAVNLSSLQFEEQDLCKKIAQALRDTSMDPRYLELELTEGIVMRDAGTTIAALQRLKQLGLRLAIDDFGTGYSSLSYLKRFPIDTVKIDRAFVRDLAENSDDAAIVTAIIAMAHSLKLRALAEGVETRQQLAFLQQQGCDEFQGYLVSKPVPAEDLAQLLRGFRSPDTREVSVPAGLG